MKGLSSAGRSSAAGFSEETKQTRLLLKLFKAYFGTRTLFSHPGEKLQNFFYVSKNMAVGVCFQGV